MIGKEIVSKEISQPQTNSGDAPLLDTMYSKLQDFFSTSSASTEAKAETFKLSDGTTITSPIAEPMVLTQSEVAETTDLFAEFGIDTTAFLIGYPKEPVIIGSSNLDFWTAFDEYTKEDLYVHYSSEKCESTRLSGPNCLAYAYGISKDVDGYAYEEKPSPGHFAGLDTSAELSEVMSTGSPTLVKRVFENYMKMDFEALGKELKEVDSNNYQPQKGERMFALVTAPNFMGCGSDFHFYVKDKNGYWSHKPGTTNPTIFDHSGSTIKDPKICDRGDYTNFVGYYVIKDK